MFTLPHPALYWNKIMNSFGRKATMLELKEAARAAEWMRKRLPTKKFQWFADPRLKDKGLRPQNIDDTTKIIGMMERGGPQGSAVSLREGVINKYVPDLLEFSAASTIGGSRSPASAALLHELGHSMPNGLKIPQASILADAPAGALGYAGWMNRILPSSMPGKGLVKYVERAPLLAEEARASINAMRALGATGASRATKSNVRRSLLGSFGTYLNPF